MNYLRAIAGFLCLCTVAGCTSSVSQQETVKGVEGMSQSEAVVKTIMERRSIRKYKPQPVEREKMQTIVECGVNAPNAMNRQPWEVRVVDNPDFINGVTEQREHDAGCPVHGDWQLLFGKSGSLYAESGSRRIPEETWFQRRLRTLVLYSLRLSR